MALFDLVSGSLREKNSPPAVTLEPDAKIEMLAEVAKVSGPVALRFPSFGDGRGLSLARLLRERHGFAGEIRAVGYLIPDLAPFLLRSGFDTAAIASPEDAAVWRESLTRLGRAYQPAYRNPFPLRRDASRQTANELNSKLAGLDRLTDRIETIRTGIEGRIAFSTSLGMEDQAILHAIAETDADMDIFTLDTGRLFPEVLETLELSEIRYRRRIRVVAPDAKEVEELVARDGIFGFRNSVANRLACCEVRKVRPLNRELKGARGWMTGLRREHSDNRAEVPLAGWDEAHALIKVNPIADWPLTRLEAYLKENDVPTNPLHARGFISIGCAPCTRAIQPGEHPRAGRWWWENEEKKECGIHLNPLREGRAA